MLIATKKVEYIRPESVSNPDAEQWEFFLVWIGVDGGVYCWLFEDFTRKTEVAGQVINSKSASITKRYEKAENSVLLTAEDLSENEYDTITKITRALVVRRYFRDGTFQPLAIVTNSINKPKSQFRYNIEIEVREIDSNLLG